MNTWETFFYAVIFVLVVGTAIYFGVPDFLHSLQVAKEYWAVKP